MITSVQKWIEGVYQLDPSRPLSQYLINHTMLVDYLGRDHPLTQAEEVVIIKNDIKNEKDDVALGLYLHNSLLKRRQGTSEHQTHQIITITEGVSHLLLILHHLRLGENFSKLELELQAEIDKFLFLRMGNLSQYAKLHLNKKSNLKNLSHSQKITYETARQLAYRYCMHLEKEYLAENSLSRLFVELRHFYRMNHWAKLRFLRNM